MLLGLRKILKHVISARKGGGEIFKNKRTKELDLLNSLFSYEKREIARIIRKRQNYFSPGLTKKEIMRRKRFSKKIIRKINIKKKRKDFEKLNKYLMSTKYKESKILNSLLKDRKSKWVPPIKRDRSKHNIELKDFSILDYPKKTIDALQEIAFAESRWLGFSINFSDIVCMDITPYLILGLMRLDMAKVVAGGKITPAVTGMVDAVGLSDLLSITHIYRQHISPTFLPFRVRYRRASGSSTSQDTAREPSTREELTDDLIKTVDIWLRGLAQRELNKEGKGNLSAIIGEILNNAERHSDLIKRDGDWAIAGFLSSVKENEDSKETKFYCSLAIISLGATIADSIAECEDAHTKACLDGYISKHENIPDISKDCLATIYALQDGVSRLQQDETGERSRGGVGMMDMIQFVGMLGFLGGIDKPPEITLLSGDACINIRKPHFDLALQAAANNKQRQIWFNNVNDIVEPPNTTYVYRMPVRFPGTAVAMRFCINPRSTSAGEEEGGE